jgi:hypothetical protein
VLLQKQTLWGGVSYKVRETQFNNTILNSDELGRITSYTYDEYFINCLSQTLPSGQSQLYTYDLRNNITKTTYNPVSNIPSGQLSLVRSVTYLGAETDVVCQNAVLCNRPSSVTDERGNRTEYTYDPVHGGVLTETLPANANGLRLQKRYSYAQMSAKAFNSSGTLIVLTPIWKLTKVSECTSASAANPASCVGTANEKVKTFRYNNNNLWLSSETLAAGDESVSATLNYTYDPIGNVTSIKGPRTDIDDTRYMTYDTRRWRIFEIGLDPDGTGPLARQIIRHVFAANGDEVRTEYGTGFATTGADFIMSRFTRVSYDSIGRPVKTEVVTP